MAAPISRRCQWLTHLGLLVAGGGRYAQRKVRKRPVQHRAVHVDHGAGSARGVRKGHEGKAARHAVDTLPHHLQRGARKLQQAPDLQQIAHMWR